ncbi:MAG: RICIN domain-containing protein [Nocardiopsaceae bacterium]|nr:RICIN domain-containing protein [Nocardiopsaceae bacterium]
MFRSRLFTGLAAATAAAAAAVSTTALAAGSAQAAVGTGAVASSSHASPQDETEAGLIRNYHSGLCLDVTGGDYRPGAPLQQWDCGARGGADQHFLIVRRADGTGALLARGPGGQLWGVAAPGEGHQLILTFSRPDMLKTGPFYTFLSPLAPTLAMDVEGSSTANGAHVIGYPENGGDNQEWSNPIP